MTGIDFESFHQSLWMSQASGVLESDATAVRGFLVWRLVHR